MKNEQSSSTAFLIDADNLSPNAVDDAFSYLQKLGVSVPVRRAYGGLEKLVGMKEVLRKHAVHAFVNQGKGTTDVALVVDAMDLLHRAALPATVAIGSSDADFSPLAVRLREAGMRVICFAQKIKAADGLPRAYDEVVYVDAPLGIHHSFLDGQGPFLPVVQAQRVEGTHSTVKKAAVKKTPAKKVVAKKAPAKKAAAKKTLLSAGEKVGNRPLDVAVSHILNAVPALKTGQPQPLGDVVKLLHDAKVLGKSASSTKLFKKFPGEFEVSLKSPHQVRYLLPQT